MVFTFTLAASSEIRISLLKPGDNVDGGSVGEWAEQNGGGKKHLDKQQNFATCFYYLPVRISYNR